MANLKRVSGKLQLDPESVAKVKQYEEKLTSMNSMPAKGMRGFLIRSTDGSLYFRVYNKNKDFADYKINHHDLEIVIDDDSAALYEKDGEFILDYNLRTLGLEKKQG